MSIVNGSDLPKTPTPSRLSQSTAIFSPSRGDASIMSTSFSYTAEDLSLMNSVTQPTIATSITVTNKKF